MLPPKKTAMEFDQYAKMDECPFVIYAGFLKIILNIINVSILFYFRY